MFTIFSIGDSAFLEQILNAVAMICGTGDFVRLVSIGMLLGVIAITIQSIVNGAKDLNIQHIFIGWIMYACFFGPSVTVTIEDAYTGQVRVVDNVPLGVGFAGGMISNVGYGVTRIFEQGYQAIASMDRPFADSLHELQSVRRHSADINVLNAMNQALGGHPVNIQRSLQNYIQDCTFARIALGEISKEEVRMSNFDIALAFNSEVYGTEIYLSSNGSERLTCAQAWPRVREALAQTGNPDVIKALNTSIGRRVNGQGAPDYSSIESSMQQLSNVASDAQKFIQTSIVDQIFLRAASNYYKDYGDIAAANMVNQAIAQRNSQWAAEQTLFMSTVRPMLAFFEGFIYAITPVMGFLFVIGLFGIKLALRYFQTVIWIQLWMPVMSICNLYITMGATSQMASYAFNEFDNFYILDRLDSTMQTWIATGGMLCAMTPMIALFLVTGSTYAFTTIASRLGGSDHINEKQVTPDTFTADALHTQSSLQKGDAASTMKTGFDSQFQTISTGAMASASMASASARMNSAMDTFGKNVMNSVAQGQTINDSAGYMTSVSDSLRNSESTGLRNAYNQAYQSALQFTDNKELAHSYATAVTTQAGLQGGIGGSGIAKVLSMIGGMSGGWNEQDVASLRKGAQQLSQDAKGISLSAEDSAALEKAYDSTLNTSSGKDFIESQANSRSSSLNESAQNVLSAQEEFRTAQMFQQTMGSRHDVKSSDIVSHGFANNAAAFDATLGSVIANMDANTRSVMENLYDGKLASGYMANGQTSATSVRAASAIEALMMTGQYEQAAAITKAAYGYSYRSDFDAASNSGISGGKGVSSSEFAGFNRNISGPSNFSEQMNTVSGAAHGGSVYETRTDAATSVINDKYGQSRDHVSGINAAQRRDQFLSTIPDRVNSMNELKVPTMSADVATNTASALRLAGAAAMLPSAVSERLACFGQPDEKTDVLESHASGPRLEAMQQERYDNMRNFISSQFEPELKAGTMTEKDIDNIAQATDNALRAASVADSDNISQYLQPVSQFYNKL